MRKVLIALIVILALLLAGLLGFIWFDSTHFFVEGRPYPNRATELDLREEEISEAHFLTVQNQLPQCRILWNVPFQGAAQSSDAASLTLSTVNQEDIRILAAYFPELRQIDAGACRDYAMLEVLAQQLPDCSVSYQVDLGGTGAAPDAVEVSLAPGAYDFDVLMENLVYLTALERIHLPKSELTVEQRELLSETYPDIAVSGTVELLGREYDTLTTSLDLSAMTSADVAAAAGKLSMLTALETVALMDASGSSRLTKEDVLTLKEAAPNAVFHYVFDFYGVSIDTTDEEVTIKGIKVTDGKLEENLRMALSLMENCDRFVLDAKGQYDKIWKEISCETLAQIREDYRDSVKFVWRIYFGKNGSTLTDAEVLRAVYDLTDDNSKDLIYCENVRYLDLGHNEFLDYMDFLSGMKELEVAILSGAPLKSLDPIAACKNLKFLEIANCIYLPDIDALKECTQLEMLNISCTRFEDMSVLNDLNLTHLTTVQNQFVSRGEPSEALQTFIDEHPDCWVVYEGSQPYGVGWRYDEEDEPLEWYSKMIDAFRYPNPYNNVGWYLKTDE